MKKYSLFLIVFFIFFNVDAHNQFSENKLKTELTSLVVVPTFSQVEAICWGSLLDDLPTTSTNGIAGTWFPAINNEQTTIYTFTPNVGQDATTASMIIIVKPLLAPTITCGTWSPNQKTFDWAPVAGATTYAITYAINEGPYINVGFGAMLTYTISGVLQTDDIEILVVPSGSVGNCFTAGILNCQGASCPQAGNSGSITVCDSNTTVINLFDIISNEDLGGTWIRTSGVGGTFNASDATFIPAVGTSTSTFMYTVVGTLPCPDDSSIATITVNPTVTTNLFCDPSNITTPNSVAFDWSAIPSAINYQFSYYINDVLIASGMTSVSHYEVFGVLSGQTVTFALTNAAGVSSFQPISTTCSNLANPSFETDTFQSSPNPVSDILNLTNVYPINSVTIINALGQHISSQSYDSKSIQIDMSGLMSGIYMVKVSSDNNTKTIKIIKD